MDISKPVTELQNNHQANLDNLCRICCAVLAGYSFDVKSFIDEISNAFRTDFKKDIDGVHPGRFCPKCHAAVKHFTSRGSCSTMTPFSWEPHNEQSSKACILRCVKAKGGRPKKRKRIGRPTTITSVEDVMSLDDKKPIPPHVEKMMSHLLAIKVKQSTLPNNTIQVESGGPQPLTLTPISVAKNDSCNVTQKTLRSRSQQVKEIIGLISGPNDEAIASQTSHIVSSFDAKAREDILNNFKSTVSIPENHVASMKSTLNIPWSLMRDIRRWLKTFKVNLAAEGRTREVVKEWVGTGLCSEEVPAMVMKDKKNEYRIKTMVLHI